MALDQELRRQLAASDERASDWQRIARAAEARAEKAEAEQARLEEVSELAGERITALEAELTEAKKHKEQALADRIPFAEKYAAAAIRERDEARAERDKEIQNWKRQAAVTIEWAGRAAQCIEYFKEVKDLRAKLVQAVEALRACVKDEADSDNYCVFRDATRELIDAVLAEHNNKSTKEEQAHEVAGGLKCPAALASPMQNGVSGGGVAASSSLVEPSPPGTDDEVCLYCGYFVCECNRPQKPPTRDELVAALRELVTAEAGCVPPLDESTKLGVSYLRARALLARCDADKKEGER